MIWACSPRDQTNFFGIKALMHVCMWILLRNSRYWDSNQDILWNWVQNMPSQATYFNSSFSNHRMRKVEGIKGSMGWKALFDKSHRITKMHSVVGTEGWGHFIFPLIHKKTIPAQPRVFLGSPENWEEEGCPYCKSKPTTKVAYCTHRSSCKNKQ